MIQNVPILFHRPGAESSDQNQELPSKRHRQPVKLSLMQRRNVILGLAALAVSAPRAQAHSYKVGDIEIGHAWALPSEGNEAQAFCPLFNNGTAPDELIAARSSICTRIELRRNNAYDDPPLSSFALDPGRPLALRPTARHFRLMGLEGPLLLDQRFTVILAFRNAGEAKVEFHVEKTPGE